MSRVRQACAAVCAWICALVVTPVAEAGDNPRLKWQTLESPHFRISFYSGEQETAIYVADLAEAIQGRLAPVLGWTPKEKVEISLTDQTDSANGITSGLPYNSIRLYLTAPDDLSPLGDVDDWYQELFTHEYTHTLHVDHMHGLPSLLNAILGRTFIPNQVQPRWILEGLAVLEESERTSGGRLRSSQWNMFMRADVLEDNVAPLDVFSNTPKRWPQGNIWYLYGSFFLRWISETYGEAALRKMIHEYGSNIVPFGVNRAIRRATGRTFEELYPAWVETMQREFRKEAARTRARGLREGTRLTFHGNGAQHPRWVPKKAWSGFDLVYFRDDTHTTPGQYGFKLKRGGDGTIERVVGEELVLRTNGVSTAAFSPDGKVYFDSVDFTDNLFPFGDLFRAPASEKAPGGLEGTRERLTEGFRTTDPDVSPDGKQIVFVTNHRGTTYLQLADVRPEGIAHVRSLVRSELREQAYAPRWSPDGTHVAYSAWTEGGYRDIRYVDVATGQYVEVTHDRAIDGGPAFSPDGKQLFFHSDRTGIMNVYAWEIATGKLRQVTNVLNGAYQPAVSPDGKTLAYVGYTHEGFDLFALPIDASSWTDAPPVLDTRPPAPPRPPHHDYPIVPYNPLETLRPRAYSVQTAPGNFGQAISVTVAGADIAGMHSFVGTLSVETDKPEPQVDVNYVYARLPFDMSLHASRGITPQGGFQIGDKYRPTWVQEATGLESTASFFKPGGFDNQSASIGYGFTRIGADVAAVPPERYDPYETPHIPGRGFVGTMNLGWSYSNAQRFLHGVGPEKGLSLSATVTLTHPLLASDYKGISSAGHVVTYFKMPWFSHHALALHSGFGASTGSFPGAGPFFVGGFVDIPVVTAVRNLLIQGGFVLRGYPSAVMIGRNYALLNAEYRFPILNIDRGISTLPVFLNRITGAFFLDYGTAFNDVEGAKFKGGAGAELWTDSTLAYILGFTFRLGYAHGWTSGGEDKVYFVAAVPF